MIGELWSLSRLKEIAQASSTTHCTYSVEKLYNGMDGGKLFLVFADPTASSFSVLIGRRTKRPGDAYII